VPGWWICTAPLKILGEGEITRAIQLRADRVSASAKAKIEAAGGTVEELKPRKVKGNTPETATDEPTPTEA
jgi:ribosomal protein L18E